MEIILICCLCFVSGLVAGIVLAAVAIRFVLKPGDAITRADEPDTGL